MTRMTYAFAMILMFVASAIMFEFIDSVPNDKGLAVLFFGFIATCILQVWLSALRAKDAGFNAPVIIGFATLIPLVWIWLAFQKSKTA